MTLEHTLSRMAPMLWLNPSRRRFAEVCAALPLGRGDLLDAESRLRRFAGLLRELFPELAASGGIIESPLVRASGFGSTLQSGKDSSLGCCLVKADHALPVAGSIKARGGIYEVLVHAEELAIQNGLMAADDERSVLATERARDFFSQYRVAVGSTGNLGLSIGVMAATLGFRATVHMSAEAKSWKKERLRSRGVEVIEHEGDYEAAVAAGRAEARCDSRTYFVDDERSSRLFLGYAVAALRLDRQLKSLQIRVDAEHPLFVYLPCGVGGAPGGITFGLHHVFGEYVHCFFAEPLSSPCMLLRLASSDDRPISVRDLGLDNRTEADGLAVARASEFAASIVKPLVSGIFTVPDDDLFTNLYSLELTQGMRIEPSAAAALGGPLWVLYSQPGAEYLSTYGLSEQVQNATHVLWTTGGLLLPEDEYRGFHERGRELHRRNAGLEGRYP